MVYWCDSVLAWWCVDMMVRYYNGTMVLTWWWDGIMVLVRRWDGVWKRASSELAGVMLGRAGERDPASQAGHRIYNSNSGKVGTMRHQTHTVLFLLVCLATQAKLRYVRFTSRQRTSIHHVTSWSCTNDKVDIVLVDHRDWSEEDKSLRPSGLAFYPLSWSDLVSH